MLVKQRFDVLDGLRGIAAIAVLLLHITPVGSPNIFAHATLAVDFFFVLSGFVIATAYRRRLLTTMSLWKFSELRLIRLMPLVVLSAVIGAIGYRHEYSVIELSLLLVACCFLIPTPYGASSEGQPAMAFGIVSWSLFWELWINIFYAVIVRRLTDKILATIVIISAAGLGIVAIFYGRLDGGVSWSTFLVGLPRVSFSFFAGVGVARLHRARWLRGFSIPSWVAAGILTLTMLVPRDWDLCAIYELFVIFFIFPALVGFAANATVGRFKSTYAWLGSASYPIYILQSGFVSHIKAAAGHVSTGHFIGTLALAVLAGFYVLLAHFISKWLDEPFRRWLTRTLKAPKQHSVSQTAP